MVNIRTEKQICRDECPPRRASMFAKTGDVVLCDHGEIFIFRRAVTRSGWCWYRLSRFWDRREYRRAVAALLENEGGAV